MEVLVGGGGDAFDLEPEECVGGVSVGGGLDSVESGSAQVRAGDDPVRPGRDEGQAGVFCVVG